MVGITLEFLGPNDGERKAIPLVLGAVPPVGASVTAPGVDGEYEVLAVRLDVTGSRREFSGRYTVTCGVRA